MTSVSRALDAVLWTVALASLGTVVLLSLGPGGGRSGIFAADKLWHAVGYGALTGTWLLAAVWRPGRGEGRFPQGAPVVVVGAVLLGAMLELFQILVGRSADPLDWLANVVGVSIVSTVWLMLRGRAPA